VADRVLVDTSVWVDHVRRRSAGLVELLEQGRVQVHPLVIGELACRNLSQRAKILQALSELSKASVLEHDRVLAFLEAATVMGRGLGGVDVSLLASAAQSGVALWTLDRRLAAAARELQIALPA
jgi:predicted nucleic acid-binding protein